MNDDPTHDVDDFDVFDDLARAEQRITIRTETRRFGKTVTIAEGFDPSLVDVTEVASELKRGLGTGGTAKDDRVELQGDHRERLPDLLEAMGFAVEP